MNSVGADVRRLIILPEKIRASSRRLLQLLACLGLLSSTTAFAAQKKPASPAPPGNRFLFVVETSNAMLPFEHAGRQAVFDLVYFGIGNQIQPGDTIGLWTFGEEAHGGGFPMQVWAPDQNLQLASSIGVFLKNQKPENQARLEHVAPKLASLIKAVKDVNILIVSSSEPVWKGTAFEQDINLAYQKHAVESRNAKRPLITTLVARQGEIASWSVTLAGDPISIPQPTPAEKLVQAGPAPLPASESKAGTSNGVPAISAAIASKSTSADPAPAPLPSSNSEAKANTPIRTSGAIKSIVITSKQIVTNGEPAPEIVQNAVSENQLKLASKTAPPGEEGKSLTAPATTPPANPAPLSIPLLAPAPLPVAAREKPISADGATSAPAPPPMAMTAPPTPFFTSRNWFVVGAALTLLTFGFLIFARRLFRPAPRPSFITRSFDRDKP